MRASIFQSDTAGMTPAQRLDRLADAARGADADLLVCPELFLSGYACGDDLKRYAEPAGGASAQAIAEIARETGTAIAYGYPEQAGSGLYNSACCIGADGVRLANHRKYLLPPGFEGEYFSPCRTGLTLFEIAGVRIAMLICYDAEFPETVRAVAGAGAQVIVVPTALGAQWGVVAHRVIPARAFENGVYVLYANHAGTEGGLSYLGASCIVAPDGTDAARAGAGEELVSAKLDMDKVAAAQARLPYLRDVTPLRAAMCKP